MIVKMDIKDLEKKLYNITQYSLGFLDGAEAGKSIFSENLAKGVITVLKDYIDAEARMNPQALHHIYEWYQVGSPAARLYNINYSLNANGVMFNLNFKQSRSLSHNSNTPFKNKARIMELGRSVNIKPVKAEVLSFDVNGTQVFTKKGVKVDNPGGDFVQGSFKKVVDEFFLVYFKQSFLKSSGIYEHIKRPMIYKTNFAAGARGGRQIGYNAGFKWIAGTMIGVE